MEFWIKGKGEINEEGNKQEGKHERFQHVEIFGEVNKEEGNKEDYGSNFIFIIAHCLFSDEIHIDNKDKIRNQGC